MGGFGNLAKREPRNSSVSSHGQGLRNYRSWKALVIAETILSFALGPALVLGQGGSGRAPQNGSGRGGKTNSVQRSRKTARTKIIVGSLAGTAWEFKVANGGYEAVREFRSDGLLIWRGSIYQPATWRQYGRRVVIFNPVSRIREEGTINGNLMRGTGQTSIKYEWTAKRIQ